MYWTGRLLLCLLACVSSCRGIDWSHVSGQLKHISVGFSGVWGVNNTNDIFYRVGSYDNQGVSGSSWNQVVGKLKQIDVGKDVVWGINDVNEVFARLGISRNRPEGTEWVKVEGGLKHVSVSDEGYVWGVNPSGTIYYREGAGPVSEGRTLLGYGWTQVPGQLKQVSVGQSGVWGVNDNDDIFYREGTSNDNGQIGSGWTQVPGSLSYVSSGYGVVIGVNSQSNIFKRQGVGAGSPQGLNWSHLSGLLVVVDGLDPNTCWGVNSADNIFLGNN